MIDETFVDLSRLQFAVTALFHFLFVPLTIGMTWILVIMESVYVMTGREIYRDMTKFWASYLVLTLLLAWRRASPWNLSLVLTGRITRTMWVMYLVRHWPLKA